MNDRKPAGVPAQAGMARMTVVVFDALTRLLCRRVQNAPQYPMARTDHGLQSSGRARSPLAVPGSQVHLIAITLLPPWKGAR
ncbi:hypothetical protein AB0B79_05650 [Streptomyces sp. NPDC039022]|uniref:hypothetical protein n=1 Tax=unclassified Streptomyces TaxID=2593676 RepID=UPI0033F3FF6C